MEQHEAARIVETADARRHNWAPSGKAGSVEFAIARRGAIFMLGPVVLELGEVLTLVQTSELHAAGARGDENEQFDCVLWTDDRRLLRLLEGRLPFVRPISEYEATA